MPPIPLPPDDLDHVLARTRPMWEALRGERLFMTGGTGFFGCWLLESFLWANDRLHLGAEAVVLTRDPEAFRRKAPHLAGHAAVALLEGDVLTCSFPEGRFSHVIHAATDADARLHQEAPLRTLDTIVTGTRRTLEFARAGGARRFLLVSSGAIYGPQAEHVGHLSEDLVSAGDPASCHAAYAEGKRMAELLTAIYAREAGFEAPIARCFAFVGPHVPLDAQFAIGNFVRDALEGRAILVKGSGEAVRSYLYAADLAIWLWTILFRGASARAYNVGSEIALTTLELAQTLACEAKVDVVLNPQPHVQTAANRYVPSTRRAQTELGLKAEVPLDEALRRTLAWYRRLRPAAPLPAVQ